METTNNLKEIRERRGLTQAQLADRTGQTISSVCRVEKGTLDFPGRVWKVIARVLDCTMDDLLGV